MDRPALLALVAAVAGTFMFAGCGHLEKPGTSHHPAPLPLLVRDRLSLAREVAWTKFHSGTPVPDPAREAVVLDEFVDKATSHGVDAGYARRFFLAQLEASRAVQTELLENWGADTAARPGHPPRDLRSDLRPRLDRITAQLAASLSAGDRPSLAELTTDALREAGFSPRVVAMAVAPLR
jgi:chorismate mutase, putative